MEHIDRLLGRLEYKTKPWLVVGKGPSYELIRTVDTADFFLFTLNHVIKNHPGSEISHMIDFDVFLECADDIYRNARHVVMPMHPHFAFKATPKTLSDLIKENETLAKLDREGRLFWYNHTKKYFRRKNVSGLVQTLLNRDPARIPEEKFPLATIGFFSAEAPFQLLGMNGITDIVSVGVDGGSAYAPGFSDKTLLANGHSSFNDQAPLIARSINRFNINYEPLGTGYPVKIYVGTQEEQMLAVKVLEHSIKKHTPADIELFPMCYSTITPKEPREPANRQRTPFSFQRFTIPALNKYQGKAIYMDSDMQVFKDIRKMWTLPMGAHDLYTVAKKDQSDRKLHFSVMMLDCAKLDWDIDTIVGQLDNKEFTYEQLMQDMCVARKIGVEIPHVWNCLEWYDPALSGLVHYTDMEKQPWVEANNPIGPVWFEGLFSAVEDGFISLEYIADHIQKGWVRPSLLWQVQNRFADNRKLPADILALDKDFVPAYRRLLPNAALVQKTAKAHKQKIHA